MGKPMNLVITQKDRDQAAAAISSWYAGQSLVDQLSRAIATARDEGRAEQREVGMEALEAASDALHKIASWADAYPLQVFPEPDFVKVRALLAAGGITIDVVSASNMRHVIEQVGPIAKNALAAIRKGEP